MTNQSLSPGGEGRVEELGSHGFHEELRSGGGTIEFKEGSFRKLTADWLPMRGGGGGLRIKDKDFTELYHRETSKILQTPTPSRRNKATSYYWNSILSCNGVALSVLQSFAHTIRTSVLITAGLANLKRLFLRCISLAQERLEGVLTLDIFRCIFFPVSLSPPFFFFLIWISGKYEKVNGLVTSISEKTKEVKNR